LSLTAVTGALPCNAPADGPCSKTTLTLTLQSFTIATNFLSAAAPWIIWDGIGLSRGARRLVYQRVKTMRGKLATRHRGG
jgi:hypothetical protein